MQIKWAPVRTVAPRKGLDMEFAIINGGGKMLLDEPIKLSLPEELRSRIGKSLPTTLRVSISGIKDLKFKDIKEESIPKGGPVPTEVSFKIDRLPANSMQFYRLRFPIPSIGIRKNHLQRLVHKRAFIVAVAMIVALAALFFFRRRIPFLNRKLTVHEQPLFFRTLPFGEPGI